MLKYKVNKSNLFKYYLLWLDPLLNLTIPEREVLAALLTLDYNRVNKTNKLLFNEDIYQIVRKKLRMAHNVFNKALNGLIDGNHIVDNILSEKLTKYPERFQINVQFILE